MIILFDNQSPQLSIPLYKRYTVIHGELYFPVAPPVIKCERKCAKLYELHVVLRCMVSDDPLVEKVKLVTNQGDQPSGTLKNLFTVVM